MASNSPDDDMELQANEAIIRQVQELQLQEKRMRALVEQRKQEREAMELQCARMERQKRYMNEMMKENEEVEEQVRMEEEAKKPFSGRGNVLGAPSLPAASPARRMPAPRPVDVDADQPTTNIQVRLADGSRLVVKLNHSHTIGQLKQEIRARKPEEQRPFILVTTGLPAKKFDKDDQTVKEADLLGATVLQRTL